MVGSYEVAPVTCDGGSGGVGDGAGPPTTAPLATVMLADNAFVLAPAAIAAATN